MWKRRPVPASGAAAGVVVALALGGCTATAEPADSKVSPTEPAAIVTLLEPRPEYEAVGPGTYVMKPIGVNADYRPWAEIEVASDAFSQNGVFLTAGGETTFRGVGLWTIVEVAVEPCSDNTRFVYPGPTVADLANAFAAQPLTNASSPVQVSVDGYDGLYMEISVPTDIDISDCVNDQFLTFRADDGGPRFHQGRGQVDRLWILDVGGNRLVFDTSHMPDTSPEETAELTEIAESITFTNTSAS